jgi:hypothetical protein
MFIFPAMKKTYLLLLFSAFAVFSLAQQPVGKMVVGLETGFDGAYFNKGVYPRIIPSVQVEYPIGKFSVGVGLGKQLYRDYEFDYYTGQNEELIVNEEAVTRYYLEIKEFSMSYWTVPVKLNFRLPCNCVYLHGGVAFNFLDDHKPERSIGLAYQDETEPLSGLSREVLVKKRTTSYEVGVGFKLQINDYVRLVGRPSYVWSENPELLSATPYLGSVRMTFGAQYAFFHY